MPSSPTELSNNPDHTTSPPSVDIANLAIQRTSSTAVGGGGGRSAWNWLQDEVDQVIVAIYIASPIAYILSSAAKRPSEAAALVEKW
jgi:hypothetical protein